MQATARRLSVVYSKSTPRRRLIRDVDMAPVLASGNVDPLSFLMTFSWFVLLTSESDGPTRVTLITSVVMLTLTRASALALRAVALLQSVSLRSARVLGNAFLLFTAAQFSQSRLERSSDLAISLIS